MDGDSNGPRPCKLHTRCRWFVRKFVLHRCAHRTEPSVVVYRMTGQTFEICDLFSKKNPFPNCECEAAPSHQRSKEHITIAVLAPQEAQSRMY